MGTLPSNLSESKLRIGDIFTPLFWAEFALREYAIFQRWLEGASVFDPTMGEGNLLESLITYGLNAGYKIHELPTTRLFGNEMNAQHHATALSKFKEKYNLEMIANFKNYDLFNLPKKKYDIVFGNPPWQNFVDLPQSYKKKVKPLFLQYDLINRTQELLLGGSRIDIAALVVQCSILDFLKPNGQAVFFLPLSLLLNDGASKNFRTFKVKSVHFALQEVYDFQTIEVFENVGTRYGLVGFKRDTKTAFPIPYFVHEGEKWARQEAAPLFTPRDPLSISQKGEAINITPPKISVPKTAQPRQGVNTCGANDVYFFTEYRKLDDKYCIVGNKKQQGIILPLNYIYPLLTAKNFKSECEFIPEKWALLPYAKNGKPLEIDELKKEEKLWEYLNENKEILQQRKGTLLGAQIKKGYWWAMLGVGAYSFAPFKVVWEAYGKNTFSPKLFLNSAQANQSLQAFMPFWKEEEAKAALKLLNHPNVERYLLSLKMQGTMNWAQPGKIKKILSYTTPQVSLFE